MTSHSDTRPSEDRLRQALQDISDMTLGNDRSEAIVTAVGDIARAALAASRPAPDRICPDCGLTATRIGDIHINAQLAASRPAPDTRTEGQPEE